MKPANLLFILSDEHNPRVLGCAGHPMIRTPNLDQAHEDERVRSTFDKLWPVACFRQSRW